ncbi:MAG: hypothetical protein ACJ0GH_03065 [Alphaproteobacteria bacterium]
MLKLIYIIILFFINSANSFANENLYYIEKNEVYLENNGEILELRENAKLISFKRSFIILAKNILDPENLVKFYQISDYNITTLVKDYKIDSEKITNVGYLASISVNFNKKAVKRFFEENGINLNIFISESYLIFPIFKKFNTFYLWDKDNSWYDYLVEEYDQQSLLKLYFPKKNHRNRLKISSKQVIDEDSKKIEEFLELYQKKKAIIVILEENFNLEKNIFQIKLNLSVYNNGIISKLDLENDNSFPEFTDKSQIELIAKLVINELQMWWKSKIDNQQQSDNEFNSYLVKINSENIKKSIFVESFLREIVGINNLKIKELKNNSIIYEIFTNYSPQQINLGLESKNLRMLETGSKNNEFLIEYY